jgi:hypothetical protein
MACVCAAVIALAYAGSAAVLTTLASCWLKYKWKIRSDMQHQVWSALADASNPRCCFSGFHPKVFQKQVSQRSRGHYESCTLCRRSGNS